MSIHFVLAGAALAAVSGLPTFLARRTSRAAECLAALVSVCGAVLGLAGAVSVLSSGQSASLTLPWPLPSVSLQLEVDALSSLFLIPVFLVSALASVYGLGYWSAAEQPASARRLRVLLGVLTAGMALLLVARNSVVFLFGWEAMAVSAFFLVATEDREPAVREAAWVYLVATHAGTCVLMALFWVLYGATGSLDWDAEMLGRAGPGTATAVFVLATIGFGLKAGIMPLHFWLPAAHSSAPSHVSGLLSGVMIKMGVFGIARFVSLLPEPPLWWGVLFLSLGGISALLGIASANAQTDIKRLLAYSSIENVGIIFLGMGLALIGRSLSRPDLQVLGMGGALCHVLNHSAFKPLLFFAAGCVVHSTHTRRLDALGGLFRRMPGAAGGFVIGAAAICGLPMLNGFVSELLIYLGLFRAALDERFVPSLAGASAIAATALAGALAVVCFVRCLGAVFLGTARSASAPRGEVARPSMLAPIAFLSLVCVGIGLAPWALAPWLDRAVAAWTGWSSAVPQVALLDLAPLRELSAAVLGLASLMALAGLVVRLRTSRVRRAADPPQGTWDCGYVDATSPRLQYTASSFAQILTGLLRWAVRQDHRSTRSRTYFPPSESLECEPREPLLRGLLVPFFTRWASRFQRLRVLQLGKVQVYLLYILAALIFLLSWSALDPWAQR